MSLEANVFGNGITIYQVFTIGQITKEGGYSTSTTVKFPS